MMNGSKVTKVINFISFFGHLLVVLLLLVADKSAADGEEECKETRCGISEPLIKFPFRLKSRQPPHCGYPGFDLSCSKTNQTTIEMPGFGNILKTFFVREIAYKNQTVYLDRADDIYPEDQCIGFDGRVQYLNVSISPFTFPRADSSTFFKCSSNCTDINFFRAISCVGDSRYYVFEPLWLSQDVREIYYQLVDCNCMRIPSNGSFVTQVLTTYGFDGMDYDYTFYMKWSKPDCRKCEAQGQRCRLIQNSAAQDKIECFGSSSMEDYAIVTCAIAGSLVLVIVAGAFCFAFFLSRNETENRLRIQKFLEDYMNFKPSRYAFSDIKKITNNFEEKLGQGAYGTVFKGKVSSDLLVAVKILNNSNKNGEEFINEVATMGQIHHINVVRLVGYCAEGFRRALIYEFLPNNSLDKYIALGTDRLKPSLSWETLQDIGLGIAKGIEYLHQGCDQRILHFDIKPHNILLDRNFVPKIADFGLAKLCSKDQSAVSMNTTRGTLGYIAPEVFSRNFGTVSYKSDVYSFGMVLLEMVGGRKNTSVTREDIDEVYYPEWIYNLLEEGEDLRILVVGEENANIAKKLAKVGLWCIQWHPTSRPTMKAAVKMLEGGLEELTMPPNPFASVTSSKANTKLLGRRKALELEAIAE